MSMLEDAFDTGRETSDDPIAGATNRCFQSAYWEVLSVYLLGGGIGTLIGSSIDLDSISTQITL